MKPDEANRLIFAALDIPAEYKKLGVKFSAAEPNANGFQACHAIDRTDSNPSAAVNVRTGYYVDLGPGGASMSLWDFTAKHGKHADWQAARRHYAEKTGVNPGKGGGRSGRNPNQEIIVEKWNDTLVGIWCTTKPPIITEAVRAAGGVLAKYPAKSKTHTVVALPIYGPQLVADEPIGWVVWQSGGRPLPVWNKAGQVTRTVKMKTVAGSRSGLMGRDALAKLAADPQERLIWKVEGPSDMLALWSIMSPAERDRDLVVCNSGGATENISPEIAALFIGHRVNVLHDADQAGEVGAAKWLAALAPLAAEVRQVRLPYEVKQDHGKDLRDWLAEKVLQ